LTSWLSTPATRLGTVWNDWRLIRSFVSRSRWASFTTSFVVMSALRSSRPRMSAADRASRSTSVSASTLAERTPPSSIASSPTSSPGPSVASAIARPSECSRVTRTSPPRIT